MPYFPGRCPGLGAALVLRAEECRGSVEVGRVLIRVIVGDYIVRGVPVGLGLVAESSMPPCWGFLWGGPVTQGSLRSRLGYDIPPLRGYTVPSQVRWWPGR